MPQDNYRRQANQVINASARLTDFQKIVAEHFDNKLFSFGAATYGYYMYVSRMHTPSAGNGVPWGGGGTEAHGRRHIYCRLCG